MLTDQQVRRLRRLDLQGLLKGRAADKAGMDAKTARKYRRLGKLPSEVRRMERDYRTRPDPFAEVWPQLEAQLRLNPGLEAKTLFADLQRRFPGRFADGQVRTLQRRLKQWRALEGPAKEVFFAQIHRPGRLGASDFTHCTDLRVTIAGAPLDHLIYHFVLTYSNWETGTICFAESYESLSEGLQNALWELGGSPQLHRTDRLTAAIPPGTEGSAAFTQRYQALLRHYGLKGQAIQAGHANENGDVEQSHHRFKRALDQALMLRGSRDFPTRMAYEEFLGRLFAQLNAGRRDRLAEELPMLRALPGRRLESCKRVQARVDAGSTIHIQGNTYSVASRLIGERVEARLYAERVEVWYAQRQVESLPRLRGRGKHRIEYRHVIDWLVRKPGALADYRYRRDLFPSSRFRLAYDVLVQRQPERAAQEYLSILYLAARRSESGVEAALRRLLEAGGAPNAAAVREELNRSDKDSSPMQATVGPVDLASYDALLGGKEADDDERGCSGDAGGLPEGAAPAGVPVGLRRVGSAGAAGSVQLRAVPVGPGAAGVPGTTRPADGTAAAGLAAAFGEELAGIGPEASADEGGATGAVASGRVICGPTRERAGIRSSGIGKDPFTLLDRSGIGAVGAAGAVLDDGPSGAGTARRQAGSQVEPGAEASVGLRGADPGRPGLRAAEPGGDGGAVHALGGALRAGQRDADEQPAVLGLGGDLQGCDDDGGGDRPAGASQRDRGVEHSQLPGGAGEEGEARPAGGNG
jgi:Mu transposase, C-terminal domain